MSASATLSPLEEFKRAVYHRDAGALRRVLAEHQEARDAINEPLFGFDSPALVGVSDDLAMVDVLLEFGADPNRKSSWWAGGFHPLYGASGAAAERLLAAGAVPDACAAAHLDRADLLARILAADPARVHERGGDGQTPLHFARSRRVVDLLLDAGADIDAVDVDHRATPAQWMLGEEPGAARMDIARYLVERGASVDVFLAAALGLTDRVRTTLRDDPSLLGLRTAQGEYGEKPPSSYHIYHWTIGASLDPLQVAAKFGRMETLEAMKAFASPTRRLLLACHLGRRDEAQAIVGEQPGIVESLGRTDQRMLTDEAWAGNAAAIELMLELGFDPSVESSTGSTGGTALHCAAWQGSVASVAAILRDERGRALVHARDSTYQATPIGWCCHGSVNCGSSRADHAEVARLLIGAGARVDPDMEGCSPAMQAVLAATLPATS